MSRGDNATLNMSNNTVTKNVSSRLGAGVYSYGTSVITNNIISGNSLTAAIQQQIGSELVARSPNSTPPTISNNLLGSNATTDAEAFETTPDNTNIFATSNRLNLPLNRIIEPSLAGNGGLTLTHLLPANSPAVNAGDNTICDDTDQRGVPRSDGACDIGAVERAIGDEEPSSFYVIPLPDGGSVIFSL